MAVAEKEGDDDLDEREEMERPEREENACVRENASLRVDEDA